MISVHSTYKDCQHGRHSHLRVCALALKLFHCFGVHSVGLVGSRHGVMGGVPPTCDKVRASLNWEINKSNVPGLCLGNLGSLRGHVLYSSLANVQDAFERQIRTAEEEHSMTSVGSIASVGKLQTSRANDNCGSCNKRAEKFVNFGGCECISHESS